MASNRIKVFFFIDRFRIGGMHRQVLYLARHLNREVFEPVVCAQSHLGGLAEEYKSTGCKLIDLKWKGRGSLAILFRLIKNLYIEKPDIVFIAQPPNFIYYRLARLFWFRHVIQIGSFRALTFWLGHKNPLYMHIDNILSRLLYFTSDIMVVNSVAMREHYSRKIKLNSNKEFEVILNGSDFNFPVTVQPQVLRTELNIASNVFVIVMIARLDPWKDFKTFIEAAKIVVESNSSAIFLIVGDGELRDELEQLIAILHLSDNVFLTGEKKDVFNYINLADISVLSTNGEGFSNSVMESMALAKPVIATSVGGNVELIGTTQQYGLLIPVKSAKLLSDAINFLICNQDIRKQIGDDARERIHQLCSIERYVKSYEELFKKACKIV